MAEASAPEAQVGEIVPVASVISTIDAPPTAASAPPAIVSADAVPVEITETVTVVVLGQKSEDDEGATIAALGIAAIEPLPAIVSAEAVPVETTETVTVVVPGQKSEDDEGATIAASGIAVREPSVIEESSQAAAPESEEKATELSEPTGIAEAQIEAAAVEPLSTDLNALPAIVSVEAVPVEITETVIVVVPGQKSQGGEGATIADSGIARIEPSVTEESSRAAAPESEAKATELSEPTDIAEDCDDGE